MADTFIKSKTSWHWLGTSGLTPQSKCRAASVALSCALLVPLSLAQAAPWDVTLRTDGTVSYTDNVFLNLSDEEDYVVSGTLALNAAVDGTRLTTNFDYAYSYDKYADASDLDGGRHALSMSNRATLVEGLLYFDLNGSIRERVVARDNIQPAAGRSYFGEQTRVSVVSFGPHIETTLGSTLQATARLQYSIVDFSETEVGFGGSASDDDEIFEGSAGVGSKDPNAKFGWSLEGRVLSDDDDREEYDVSGSARIALSRGFRLIGRAGYDVADTNGDGINNIDHEFWRVGFEYRPSARTSFRFEGGRRFDDTSFEAAVSHRFRESFDLTASYTHQLATDQQRFVSDTNLLEFDEEGLPVAPLSAITDIVSDTYIAKRAQLRLNGQRGKFTYSLSGVYSDKGFEITANNETVFGGNVFVRYNISRDFALFASAGMSDEDADIAINEVDIKNGILGVTYRLTPTATASLKLVAQAYEYATGIEIDENVALATISKTW